MAKRKKRMKLPNGFGSIKYLGDGRYRPYAVFPTTKGERWGDTSPPTRKAIGYTETWEEAYELLTTHNLEKKGQIRVNNNVFIDRTPLFSEVYERFYDEKFNNSPKKLSTSSIYATKAAYQNCNALHDIRFGQIRYEHLQNVINACPLKHSSLELIVSLLHQMYKYAIKYEIIDKDYSQFLYIPIPDDDESGEPFTEEQLKVLWKNKNNSVIEMLLIMCYSGFRIMEFKDIETNMKEKYFKGGIKTESSKNRIVPIHSGIYELVKRRKNGRDLLGGNAQMFRDSMYKELADLGIDKTDSGKKHTPHNCRHTFSALCEKYSVNENDRKRMLGHSFGDDITNKVYGHRTLDELRTQIEKIKIPTT